MLWLDKSKGLSGDAARQTFEPEVKTANADLKY
jgi:hypothetical protein